MSLATLQTQYVSPALIYNANVQQQTNTSSELFVANTDAKTAESDPNDPTEIGVGVGTKVILFDVTGRSYVEAFLFYHGTNPAGDVVLAAFGFFPYTGKSPRAMEPYQVDSTNFPKASAADVGGGFWLPLYYPEADGEHLQTLTAGLAEVDSDSSTPTFKIQGGPVWATNGAQRAIIVVKTATATPTSALILAKTGN
jgi:hypothetical protein